MEGMLHQVKLPIRADKGDSHYDLIVRLLRFVAGRDPATKDVGLFPMGYAFKPRAGPTDNSSDDSAELAVLRPCNHGTNVYFSVADASKHRMKKLIFRRKFVGECNQQ